jgi:hypothetical protein
MIAVVDVNLTPCAALLLLLLLLPSPEPYTSGTSEAARWCLVKVVRV